MRDDFQHSSSAITGPATRHFQIIPGANDLDVRPRTIQMPQTTAAGGLAGR